MAKNKNPYSVEKELSPEDKTGLSNLIAIAQEILESGETGEEMQAEKAEGHQEPDGDEETPEEKKARMSARKAQKDQYSDEDDDKKKPEEGNKNEIAKAIATLRKAIESTPPETTDAETDAEERVEGEGNSEMTEDALAAVAKMLLGVRSKSVKKSKPNATIAAMGEIAKAISAMNDRQTVLAKSLSKVMDITGITKQYEVTKSQEATKKGPVHTTDSEVFKSEFAKLLGINPVNTSNGVAKSQNEKVQDELGSLLSTMGAFRK